MMDADEAEPMDVAQGVSDSMPEEVDSEATQSGTETEDEGKDPSEAVVASAPAKKAPNRRSRASSPSAPSDAAAAAAGAAGSGQEEGYLRLTARQRARMEKEAGLAEDLAWHEMDLLPNLTYTWKGKGIKTAGQMTEAEWLKRQEALERRRMRSLRDKREAEEAVKAKIRRAVTARFRGKLGAAGDTPSATEGWAGGAGGGNQQEGALVRPGWVKVRHTSGGVSVAWHPAAHPLSLPMAVAVSSSWSLEPVDLSLQPLPTSPGPWQVPEASSSSFKLGCMLTLQPTTCTCTPQAPLQDAVQAEQPQLGGIQQQAFLQCMDDKAWTVGCLLQQQVMDALEASGYLDLQLQWQQLSIRQSGHVSSGLADAGVAAAGVLSPGVEAAMCWQQWRAVVKSVTRSSDDRQQLKAVVVRLVPPDQLPQGGSTS